MSLLEENILFSKLDFSFFFFFLEQHFLFSEFHRRCPFLGREQWWRLHTKDGRGPGGLLGAEKSDLQGLPGPPPGHSVN